MNQYKLLFTGVAGIVGYYMAGKPGLAGGAAAGYYFTPELSKVAGIAITGDAKTNVTNGGPVGLRAAASIATSYPKPDGSLFATGTADGAIQCGGQYNVVFKQALDKPPSAIEFKLSSPFTGARAINITEKGFGLWIYASEAHVAGANEVVYIAYK